MDWNLICWFWLALCANHNILKKTIINNNEILFKNTDKLQKEIGLDERYNNNIFRMATIKENENFNYTMKRNLVVKNLVNTLEDEKKPINFKLELIKKYQDIIYNKTEGITIINGGLFDDWDFDFTM